MRAHLESKVEGLEEVKVMMISSLENSMNESNPRDPITTTTCTSWKLYENPFYNSQHKIQHQQHFQSKKHPHHLHLPLSARKIAASFWDLAFFTPIMDTELDFARAQILELKADLEHERRHERSWRLQRRGREAVERVCEELAREMSSDKEDIDQMKREMEEERKMIRMAEVLREERVQMKLAEAKMLFEERLLELVGTQNSTCRMEQKSREDKEPEIATPFKATAILSGKLNRLVLGEKSFYDSIESTGVILSDQKSAFNDNTGSISSMATQRSRASPEPENPHIKRGIKGFVEFPRVVRATGSKNKHWGTKLECQKALLRIPLKQNSPIRSSNLVIS
ncbi:protein BRANCHLESS TRICHOME [Salix suchowensis]|nr:protein BRANCHLESS TRICHOME [Salix suchowensis]